jgi:hypothetical protein
MSQYVPPKRRLTLNGLHGVISQKMVLFITTAVRTSNHTIIISLNMIKMLGNYLVTAQLAASQEGLGSMELVS